MYYYSSQNKLEFKKKIQPRRVHLTEGRKAGSWVEVYKKGI
jgi:hypothetical protein